MQSMVEGLLDICRPPLHSQGKIGIKPLHRPAGGPPPQIAFGEELRGAVATLPNPKDKAATRAMAGRPPRARTPGDRAGETRGSARIQSRAV